MKLGQIYWVCENCLQIEKTSGYVSYLSHAHGVGFLIGLKSLRSLAKAKKFRLVAKKRWGEK